MLTRSEGVALHNFLTALLSKGFNEPVTCLHCGLVAVYPLPWFVLDRDGELAAYCGEDCLRAQLYWVPEEEAAEILQISENSPHLTF